MSSTISKVAASNVAPADEVKESSPTESQRAHGPLESIGTDHHETAVSGASREDERTVEEIEETEKGWFAYFMTRNFYIVLLLGHVPLSYPCPYRHFNWINREYTAKF